ncbi:CBS domain-containing protein [Bacillus horti]|uniref:Signal-transduction protein with cAMP-binding, CBS, and nucleotidyltransferase domain n=1 Tax=Caldalkalibacillus horti TaxID=77523 RepID=A0ABT9W3E1_9BACI|nr:CBS domain-containing protein [Bacillus horti]MDQ0167766.1 signal-transduction protein with cAMP-binding, CBS, and nucleotidyltransferase domain [Bacillus horti]
MNALMYMIPKEKLELAKQTDSVEDILKRMKEGSFKTLPVIDEAKHFVGVIHESSIYESFFYNEVKKEEFLQAEIRPLVKENVLTVDKGTDFFEVILRMEKLDIHFLPIVDSAQQFMGIVTRNKIFEAFESAFGHNRDGYLIEVVSIDAKGQLARLAKAISSTHSNIASMVHFDVNVASLERVIVKVETEKIEEVLENISNEGFRVTNHRFVQKVKQS